MTTPGGAMTGLGGLQPAVGAIVVVDPGAAPEVIHGGTANPAHGQYEWANPAPYPWMYWPATSGGAASVPADVLGTVPGELPAGDDPSLYASSTETGSHAAPWPSFGVADSAVNDREQGAFRAMASAELHALDTGQAAAFNEQAFTWGDRMAWGLPLDYTSAGETILQPVPGQMQGQLGRDRVQGTPPLNSYGFDSAHVLRFGPDPATGSVPGGFLWLDGSQRPMVIEPAGRQTYPVGAGSPFAGQVPGVGDPTGAILSGLPTGYSSPPEAPTASSYPGQGTTWSWSSW